MKKSSKDWNKIWSSKGEFNFSTLKLENLRIWEFSMHFVLYICWESCLNSKDIATLIKSCKKILMDWSFKNWPQSLSNFKKARVLYVLLNGSQHG